MNPDGRPPGCTDDVVAAIVEGLRTAIDAGLPKGDALRAACRKGGIGVSTYYDWRKHAEAGDAKYAAAVARIEEARQEMLDAFHEKVSREIVAIAFDELPADFPPARIGSKLNAAKFLVQGISEERERSQKLTLVGPDGGPINLNHTVDRAALARKLASLVGESGDSPGRADPDPDREPE